MCGSWDPGEPASRTECKREGQSSGFSSLASGPEKAEFQAGAWMRGV